MNFFDFLFENTANLEKALVVGSAETKSYREIVRESTIVANYLKSTVGQNHNILLVAPNSLFFIIAYLSIIKSGNICIPLNPAIEQESFDFVLKCTNSVMGFYNDAIINRLSPIHCKITESGLEGIIALGGDFSRDDSFDGNQLAEIIFTSGTTAKPKGVMLTHNNLIANTKSIVTYLGLSSDDRMMVVLPFYYCYGLSLLHTHLRVGGSLVLNNDFIFLGSTINDINELKCTGFAGVPSHFQILLRKSDLLRRTQFSSLRYVTQAGGKLASCYLTEFNELFPHILFYVMYGQTEATARLSFLPPEKFKEKLGSIGKGIPGVELKVVDSVGEPILPGEIGEIWARGENIMKGYFNDILATNMVLQDGWLHTGDLATIDNDGYLFLKARLKEIIKVGGNRVNPKEIEEVISMIPGVIDCKIEAVDDTILGEAIQATIAVNEIGKSIDKDFVRSFCSSYLSEYKIPSFIFFKENLELSSTGKRLSSY